MGASSLLNVPRRVLLAESDAAWARPLAEVLRSDGYDVVLSDHGPQARHLLAAERFSTVVSEWSPGGQDLLGHVRGRERDGYTYVIMTSHAEDEMQRVMAAGADDFLLKPIDPDNLLSRMRVAERIGLMQQEIAVKNAELSRTNDCLEEANARMRCELSAAARVQQALLPASSFQSPGATIGWRLRPCDELAGDILNCLRVDEHHLAFYVLDVSGHGVSSALLSVQISRLMSPLMTESELLKRRLDEPPWYHVVEPRDVIRRLNELFQAQGELTQYFTMIYGLLHLASGRLQLAAGGHPGPLIVPATGEPLQLPFRSLPVGLFEHAEPYVHEQILEVGDRIWLYSDGMTDVANARGQRLDGKRLLDLIMAQQRHPAQVAVDNVVQAVEDWCAPAQPDDDCTLLAIERDELPD